MIRELRHELAELRGAFVDQLNARRATSPRSCPRDEPSWPPGKDLDVERSAGLFLHLLGDALHHRDERMRAWPAPSPSG